MELSIPGLNVESTTVRQYNTKYAAHILGRVSLMSPEEYEKYKDYGYSMDAYVGKEGLESAFESELHGTDGTKLTTITSDGAVVSETYSKEPVAGSNVELTIDINLQTVAEQALENVILDLRENGVGREQNGKDAEGGAVVAMDVNTGEILACASYPSFDISTYSQNFDTLRDAKYAPLLNRALNAIYNPGSTYKMVTAIAAINNGVIGRYYEIEDKGIYTYYKDQNFTANCYYYTSYGLTHGYLNTMEALAVSCNYYFYEIGRLTYAKEGVGWDAVDAVAKSLGLGESTGVELPEEIGYRANAETKKKLYGEGEQGWYAADVLMASIGQSENKFTPLQLCVYTAALANGGTRYKATFLSRVISSDYRRLIQSNKAQVLSVCEISDEALAAVHEGMRMAVTSDSGTAHSVFGDYPVAVSAKTGTVQTDLSVAGIRSDSASFVCYAPSDNPQIAIAVYVENGAQGGNLGRVAKAILDAYFAEASAVDSFPAENGIG
jgi:penicillin-binding protein 2